MNLEKIPPRPVAEGAPDMETIFMQWVWDTCARKFIDTPTVRFETDGRSIRAHAKRGTSSQTRHPFQLYQGSTWLKWKVAAGFYIYTPSGDMVAATNTDTDITITANVARYWFYLDLSTGAVAAADTRPTWGGPIMPIGYVDTNTFAANQVAVKEQFTHDNFHNPCE